MFVAEFLGYENFVTDADGSLTTVRPEHLTLGGLKADQGSCRIYDSPLSEAGVMGYEPRKSGRPACCAPATSPMARAVLPEMLR